MHAVILAAGKGTRLLPLTETTPKPLVKVCGRPIIEHVIDVLPPQVDKLIIVVGHLGEQIRTRYGAQIGARKVTYIEQKNLNGTGGALRLVKRYLKAPALVVNADDLYYAPDLARVINYPWAILAIRTRNAVAYPLRVNIFKRWRGFGSASVKGQSCWQNCGVYMISPEYFSYDPVSIPVRGGEEVSLPHTLERVAAEHAVRVIPATRWLPVGTHEELAAANSQCEILLH